MFKDNIVVGPQLHKAIPDKSLGLFLYDSLRDESHNNPVFIDAVSGKEVARNDFLHKTCLLAGCLASCGYNQNDIVSICAENSAYFFEPVVAALYLGICVAPINQNYGKNELLHTLNITKPKLVFCSNKYMYMFVNMRKLLPFIEKIIVFDLQDRNVFGVEGYEDFLRNNSRKFDVASFKPVKVDIKQHLAVVLCSSGTTGLPKGVMITHRNMHHRLIHLKDKRFYKQIQNSVYLNVLPFFHAFGFMIALENMIHRNTIVVLDRFKGELFLDAIQRYRISHMWVVPTILVFLLKSPLVYKYDLSSVQEIGCGAAPLGKEIQDKIRKIFNLNGIMQGYGLTESTMAITIVPFHSPKLGSCGKVVPGISIKIVDCVTGESLGPRKLGELCIKGGMIMKGYYNNPEATKTTIKGDWLLTGDLGYYDEEGYVYIVDRLKELIKYKSFQVAPAELEAILLSNPKIKDAAVIGIPDEEAGELPCAFVVKQNVVQLSETDVKNFVANQVTGYKHLRGGVRFVEEIPKNASGKILRRVLRKQFAKKSSKL